MPFRSRRNPNHGPRNRSERRSRARSENLEIVGRIVELDLDRKTAHLEDERKNQRWRLDLSSSRFYNLSDANGDGKYSIADLFPGDRVRVRAYQWGKSFKARTLWRIGSPPPPGGLRKIAYPS